MRILSLKPHSFIDVITNSSTELFVCNTDKTIKVTKEILQKKWDAFRELYKEEYIKNYNEEDYKEYWPKNVLKILMVEKSSEKTREEMGDIACWGPLDGHAKDGDILIMGVDDNSIPYKFWDVIEEIFNAKSYHLG